MRSTFGTITKRAHNKYYIQWSDHGARRGKTINGTRAVAQKELSRIALRLSHAGGSITYSEYWEEYVTPTFSALKPKTVSEYNRLWHTELERRIGRWKVDETTWRDVQGVIDDIAAPSVQRKACTLWKKIMNMAMRDEFAQKNPCTGIKFAPQSKRAKVLLPAAGLADYMRAIEGIAYEPVLLVLLGGGLSVCEACALTWQDVTEWEGFALVNIDKDVVTCDGHALHQESTKNETRTREVVIGAPFARRLLQVKLERSLCGNVSHSGKEGERLCEGAPSTISHNYKAWCARNGVEYVRLGDMRSVYATWCGEAGCLDSLVSLQMGHKDGTTRGEHYQQATRMGKALVASTLAGYLEGEKK